MKIKVGERGKVPFYSACQLVNMKGMRKFREKTSFATTTVVLDIRQKSSMNSQTFLENRIFSVKTLSHKLIINHKGEKTHVANGETDVSSLHADVGPPDAV